MGTLARIERAGYQVYAGALVVLITGFIAVIAVRSLALAARGEYLAASPAVPAQPSAGVPAG